MLMNLIKTIRNQPTQITLVVLLIALLPFERIPSYDLAGITLRLSSIVAAVLIIASLPLLIKNATDWIKQPWVWLGAYFIIATLSTITSLNPAKGAKVLIFTGFVFIISWVVALYAKDAGPKKVISALLISTVISLIFGIYQFFGDLVGLPNYLTGLREAYTKAVFSFPRIQSFSLEPLYYANFLLIPGSVAAFFFIKGRKLYGVVLLAILVVLWLTLSRGGYYAFAVILLGAIIYSITTKKYLRAVQTIFIIAISILISLSLIFIGSNFNSGPSKTDSSTSIKKFQQQSTNTDQGESVEGRAFSRNLAIELFEQNPVKGVGPGNYGVHATNLYPERYPNDSGIVNNETLEILAETGLAGFIAILGFAVTLLLRMVRVIKSNGIKDLSDSSLLSLALFTSLLATAIQYQAFSTLYITHIWVAVGLFIGFSMISRSAGARSTKINI